jgi:uncharacterized protein YdiU (UPF0061 family)
MADLPEVPPNEFPTVAGGWRLDHSYARLPALLHSSVAPTPVGEPTVLVLNTRWAAELGLDAAVLATPAGAAMLAGNALPPGARPIAQAYAGHQFGHFTGLGDGRAILLGEQITPRGERHDVQLKGAGRTPFSRRGDGRAAAGPMLREYIVSEAMAALGVPTTRSLAVVATGEPVYREAALPGAVLTRTAASHIRVGTFQWVAAHGETAVLSALVDYTVARHYPELAAAENRALALFEGAIERQAALVARWMQLGFVHGVMNTDNMAVSGETIDYGPCAFLDAYDPATAFSSIDRGGRYAFGKQPAIAQWNLARLGETLLPLIAADEAVAVARATERLQNFQARYEFHWLAGMRRKLGLVGEEPEDVRLIEDLLGAMRATGEDFTLTFRELDARSDAELAGSEAMVAWRQRWRARLARQAVEPEAARALRGRSNPAVIPRNHQVEAALAAALDGDLGPTERLLAVLAQPFQSTPENASYRQPPPGGGVGYRTFCGT